MDEIKKFPYPSSEKRLAKYEYYDKLLESEHYEAFAIKGGGDFNKQYNLLRYVITNFCALVAKTNADFLFGEELQIKSSKNQDFLDALYFDSKLRTLNYESAMSNSALGDAIYRIRVINNEVKIEDVSPMDYFPHIEDEFTREKPTKEELAYLSEKGGFIYLLREIHTPGQVEMKAYRMKNKREVDLEIGIEAYNEIFDTKYLEITETNIDENLIIHIPNYKNKKRFFGVSDFQDIDKLQFALNNRITKIDNVLDKHNDPILAVPPGVLDEDGTVRREALNMIEVADGEGKPEYIIWNASLENAFLQIDKLVKFLFLMSETSPDVFGMGEGQVESGRALKMRLLRTLAKRSRKELYYKQGLKEAFIVAQKLAKANGYTVNGVECKDDAVIPELIFSDGLVNDDQEVITNESLKLENDLTTKKRSIMKIENISEEEAEKIIKEMEKEDANNPNNLITAFTQQNATNQQTSV